MATQNSLNAVCVGAVQDRNEQDQPPPPLRTLAQPLAVGTTALQQPKLNCFQNHGAIPRAVAQPFFWNTCPIFLKIVETVIFSQPSF